MSRRMATFLDLFLSMIWILLMLATLLTHYVHVVAEKISLFTGGLATALEIRFDNTSDVMHEKKVEIELQNESRPMESGQRHGLNEAPPAASRSVGLTPVTHPFRERIPMDLYSADNRKWYAVARGRQRGLYRSYDEYFQFIDGYYGAKHKSFKTRAEAEQYLISHGVNV